MATLRRWSILPLLVATVPAAALGQETSQRAFQWEGRVGEGRWLTIVDLNGSISVEPAAGDRVEVLAEKRWRRGDPQRVRIELRRTGPAEGDVLVCALWGESATCDENGYRSERRERNSGDVSVAFMVKVPQGVNVRLFTVNGGISVRASGQILARTINGTVTAISSGGPVSATTVNGNVEAEFSRLGSDLRFETVNGSVELRLPEAVDAELRLRTVNGAIQSDFPLVLRGRIDPRRLDATLGNGGPRLIATTVNGSVRLKRR
ncbi:MAG TPA: DUF4097 family beta strand repeat-containing protein [Gemmatimonadaceae bacterium]|nr:DUF4097 family beta strand repeat-containing protein [Gemmatimonadaceae bacterium]